MPSMDDFAGHVAATHVALDMPKVAVELEPANKQPALTPVVRASLVPRSDCLTVPHGSPRFPTVPFRLVVTL